jgi:hypothetical protein
MRPMRQRASAWIRWPRSSLIRAITATTQCCMCNRRKVEVYIPEPKRGQRRWAGKADEQKAVYANRRRVQGHYGKELLKKRGELIERSFAHCYETGAMRRVYLRGRENILKRQLIHVGAFNLSLIFRQTLRAGTPRQLRNRSIRLILAASWFIWKLKVTSAVSRSLSRFPKLRTAAFRQHRLPICRPRIIGG